VTLPVPAAPPAPMTRERLEKRWRQLLPSWLAEKVLGELLADADAYGAHMIETYARPDDRWGPG
jgi:hypothetical protein